MNIEGKCRFTLKLINHHVVRLWSVNRLEIQVCFLNLLESTSLTFLKLIPKLSQLGDKTKYNHWIQHPNSGIDITHIWCLDVTFLMT